MLANEQTTVVFKVVKYNIFQVINKGGWIDTNIDNTDTNAGIAIGPILVQQDRFLQYLAR